MNINDRPKRGIEILSIWQRDIRINEMAMNDDTATLKGSAFNLEKHVDYADGSVVSKTLIKKIKEVLSFNLPLDIICTSHGIIWRDKPEQIVERYLKWADSYQENQITIIYDTMWNGTRVMAEKIANGISDADKEVNVKLFNLAKTDKNDVITEIFKSKAILVGSPTINRDILVSVAGILEEIKGLQFKNKKAAAFGCYGWSGESTKIISENLTSAGFELVDDGIKAMWNPDKDNVNKCVEYGKLFADKVSI